MAQHPRIACGGRSPVRRRTGVAGLALAAVWIGWVAGPAGPQAQRERPDGWDDATHHRRAAPDYDRLFSLDRVHELHITIAPDDFTAMQDDLRTLTSGLPGMGGRGMGPGRGGPGRGGPGGLFGLPGGADLPALMEQAMAACTDRPVDSTCTIDGTEGRCNALFGGPPMCVPPMIGDVLQGGAAPRLISRDPIWVPVTVRHEGGVWTDVGMRYKGNSSLMSANMSQNGKVPFRLRFDRFEDEVPGTRNQRFYGFQRLTFSSNFTDDSQLHEVLATEVLRDRGVPAARAAFYRVMVDVGQGPEYWGLYTMIEDPADGAMLDAQFGSRTGHLYKPEGAGASWVRFDAGSFENRTGGNPDGAADVEAAIAALHAPRDDAARWRQLLEATFDVDQFLRWLAVNTAIENWDTYGVFAHNYYLYGDPAQDGRLRWIPWDHNMAFGMGPGGMGMGGPGRGRGLGPGAGGREGRGPGGPPPPASPPGDPAGFPGGFRGGGPGLPGLGAGVTDVLHERVGAQWPLIRHLLDDEVYAARYRAYLSNALGGLFAPEAFEARARELHALITPAIVGERGERPTHTTVSSPEAFRNALDGPNGLLERSARRRAAITEALAGQTR
jgi:spore coat protein H